MSPTTKSETQDMSSIQKVKHETWNKVKIPWAEIQLAYIQGAKFEDLETHFKIPSKVIMNAAEIEDWDKFLPAKVEQSLVEKTAEHMAAIWVERQNGSREDWHEITSKTRSYLKRLKGKDVLRYAGPAKIVLDMERKNLGLDKESGSGGKIGIAVGVLNGLTGVDS